MRVSSVIVTGQGVVGRKQSVDMTFRPHGDAGRRGEARKVVIEDAALENEAVSAEIRLDDVSRR